MGLGELWDQLVDCVCRPPRDSAYTEADLHGGVSKKFTLRREGIRGINHYSCIREDLELVNKHGQKLKCSHFKLQGIQGKEGRLPCVIYCHCNSGSRRDSYEAIETLVPMGISVFTLDFAGSGLSDGEWVTLGAHEVEDLEVAVNHLRNTGTISTLGLWGRSMGAVTALLYSQRDPSIGAIVLDSPFASLMDLMMEIVQEQELPIPKPFMKMALAAMKRSVKKRAHFDISEVCPINVVHQSFIPAKFCHAIGDTFVKIHHTERLFEAYAGDKEFNRVEGDHNSVRPAYFSSAAGIFFCNRLQLADWLVSGHCQLSEITQAIKGIDAASTGATSANGAATSPLSPTGGAGSVPWERGPMRTASSALLRSPGFLHMNGDIHNQNDDDDDDDDLARAMQASLEEFHKVQAAPAPTTEKGNTSSATATAAGTAATAAVPTAAGAVTQPGSHQGITTAATTAMPMTPEDEERMLRQAIEDSLKLAEAASQVSNGGVTAVALPAAATGPMDINYVDYLCSELSGGLKPNA